MVVGCLVAQVVFLTIAVIWLIACVESLRTRIEDRHKRTESQLRYVIPCGDHWPDGLSPHEVEVSLGLFVPHDEVTHGI
jgi:hypothetical protein